MNLIHVNSYYRVSSFYKNLFEMQKNEGMDIQVYVPMAHQSHIPSFDFGEYTLIQKNHQSLDRYIFAIKHRKIYKDFRTQYQLSPDTVIHAHSLFSNGYIAYRAHLEFGCKYVVAVRGTDIHVFFKHMIHMRSLGVNILREASAIIFLSSTMKDITYSTYIPSKLRDTLEKKTYIIPNGIDSFWLDHPGNAKSLSSLTTLKIITCGVINKNKNQLLLAEAVKVLVQRGIQAELTIVGKSEDPNILKKLESYEFVNYLGVKNRQELCELYRKNDIFAMPSIRETFGLVYAEAMSQGLPVIYTKGQGFDGQFDEGEAGFAVESDSVYSVVTAIDKIIQSYSDISSRNVQLAKTFNWSSIHKQYHDIYKGI